jgi:hypothetical protein
MLDLILDVGQFEKLTLDTNTKASLHPWTEQGSFAR